MRLGRALLHVISKVGRVVGREMDESTSKTREEIGRTQPGTAMFKATVFQSSTVFQITTKKRIPATNMECVSKKQQLL